MISEPRPPANISTLTWSPARKRAAQPYLQPTNNPPGTLPSVDPPVDAIAIEPSSRSRSTGFLLTIQMLSVALLRVASYILVRPLGMSDVMPARAGLCDCASEYRLDVMGLPTDRYLAFRAS
ncbi:uncharacterized protein BDV14DRAFT_56217 [Aspergillus stella-maris]|uniref:uncharacterized protein n=1 Tax=Aspergillus stella-maris TaxID=1810926 RepID=UPI003CCE24B9